MDLQFARTNPQHNPLPRIPRLPSGTTWRFPEQFSSRLEVVSHMVDRDREYPPSTREMDIAYDYVAGRAKVIVKEGLNSGKTFLRLYGSKKEYMIREGEFPSCRRSYLGEQFANVLTSSRYHACGETHAISL